MGEVVAAFSAVHAPQLISRPQDEELAKLDRGTDALHRLGEVLDETAPDALIVIGLDHLETFWLAAPTFTVFVGETGTADYAGRVHREVPVDTALATDLLKGLVARDFDMTFTRRPGSGTRSSRRSSTCSRAGTSPSCRCWSTSTCRRCRARGAATPSAGRSPRSLAERPGRVAVLASGGMSHFPGTAPLPDPTWRSTPGCCRRSPPGGGTSCSTSRPCSSTRSARASC